MSKAASESSAEQDIIYLDVGGRTFRTLRRTIQNYPESLIAKVLIEYPQSGHENKPVFIDRSPKTFKWILEIYRNGDYEETMPSQSDPYLQRELAFYQLPSLDELGLVSSFRKLSVSAEVMPKNLMREIVTEIKESGLEDMFPWCVYIYDQFSTATDIPPQRRIFVLPDVVRQTNLDANLSFIKERKHDAFVQGVLGKTFSLSSTVKEVSVLSPASKTKFHLQIPTENLARLTRDNAHRVGFSLELRQNGGSTGNQSFTTLPYMHLYPK